MRISDWSSDVCSSDLIRPEGAHPDKLDQTYVENLRFAAEETKKAGVRLLLEAINTIDIPGFYLSTSAPALAITESVGSYTLSLHYDTYPVPVMADALARSTPHASCR